MSGSVIVTGSDSGIGQATALALAAAGFGVGITYNTDERGARLTASRVRDLGARCAVSHLELRRDPGVVVDRLADELGHLWGLVNNAGANHRAPLLEDTSEAWRDVLELNLVGPVLCAQAAARRLVDRRRGGRIVNVTSIHEHVPLPAAAAYSAAKAGLGMATKVMALELAAHGVTVNAVAPGHIATPMTGRDGVDPGSITLPEIPLGRPGGPREVAALIAYLVSREASYSTGASHLVDGGLALGAVLPLQRATEPAVAP